MIEREKDQADLVLVVDPAHILPAPGDRATGKHLERRQHFRERSGVLVEHYTGAQQHDADAMDDRGLGGFFPVEANLGEKIVAGETVLGQLLVAMRAVVADRGSVDENPPFRPQPLARSKRGGSWRARSTGG